MDVEAAFPSVAQDCLARKMRKIGIDECLVLWMLDFMMDSRVCMVVDGQEGQELAVTMGLPQGSLASPILFAIYMHDLYEYIERCFPGLTSFSFVDDFTWLDKQPTFAAISKRFRDVSRACLRWAEDNAVHFEWSKTEAIPFSGSLKVRREEQEHDIDLVGAQNQHRKIPWNSAATRWPGIHLDHSLTFAMYRLKVVSKSKSAEGHLHSLINKFGIPPVSARNVQVAVVQSTLLYGAELWWDGDSKLTRQFQLAINRLMRGTLGCVRLIPLGPLLMEANMMPVIPLLNYRRTQYTQRLLRMPTGPRQILSIASDLSSRLNDAVLLPHELDPIKPVYNPTGMMFPGLLLPESDLEEALETALTWMDVGDTLWTDGSRLDDGTVACGVAYKDAEGLWQGQSFYLGRNKEVFDAELRAIYEAMTRFSSEVIPGHRSTIFADA
jgi:hypothetical protein